jgi:Cu/Ag efflux protein CusF
MKRKLMTFTCAALATLVTAACERSPSGDADSAAMPGMQQRTDGSGAEHMAEGTVNSVDRAAGTVNISHGPVASASWPAMTMSFKVADPNAVTDLSPGQEVQFHFTIESGMSATVTQITPAE